MELWTAVVCLVADPNCKGLQRFGANGKAAYVNVVAWAESESDFRRRLDRTAPDLDCVLLDAERVQLLDSRLNEPDCPEELITMRTTALRQRNDVVFGTFHTWTQTDVN